MMYNIGTVKKGDKTMTQLELATNLRDWINEKGLGGTSLMGFLCAYATSMEEFFTLQHELAPIFELEEEEE